VGATHQSPLASTMSRRRQAGTVLRRPRQPRRRPRPAGGRPNYRRPPCHCHCHCHCDGCCGCCCGSASGGTATPSTLHPTRPRHGSPAGSPTGATTRHATPRHATPRHATPRHATPHQPAPSTTKRQPRINHGGCAPTGKQVHGQGAPCQRQRRPPPSPLAMVGPSATLKAISPVGPLTSKCGAAKACSWVCCWRRAAWRRQRWVSASLHAEPHPTVQKLVCSEPRWRWRGRTRTGLVASLLRP
jgi:hypothetical protein